MKRSNLLLGILAITVVFAMTAVGCGEVPVDNNGKQPQSVTYESTDTAGSTYTLVVTEKTARAAYQPAEGDSYTLTITIGVNSMVSKGTILSFIADILTLQPNNEGSDTFTITIRDEKMIYISGIITIIVENEESTTVDAPGLVTPVTGGGEGEGDGVFTTIAEMATWLAAQPANTADTAYTVKLNVAALDGNAGTSGSAGAALKANPTKYVILDLSGSTITSIENSAFSYQDAGCRNLISIIIPNSVTKIEFMAFITCGLTNIIIPGSVTSIEAFAFEDCTDLISVTFQGTITTANLSDSAFSHLGDLRAKYLAAGGGIGTYTRSGAGTTASPYVWMKQGEGGGDTAVTLIGVTANGSSTVTTTQLTLTFSQAITGLSADDITLSPNDNITLSPNNVIKGTLSGNGPEYILPISGFTTGGLLYVTVTKTGYTISGGTIRVNIYYYSGSSGGDLDFTYTETANAVTITGYKGTASSVTIPTQINGKPVTGIGEFAFGSTSSPNTSLTSVTIPNSVTSIGLGAFYLCTSLTSVTIPNSVTTIEESAFDQCTSLTSITIPNGLTIIENFTFSQTGLTSITIPAGVTSIGYCAFNQCNSLTSVKFEGTITSDNFHSEAAFYGDLRTKYLAGGTGTYTRSGAGTTASPYTWMKQDGGGNNDNVFTSVEDMKTWLAAQPANTIGTPYTVKLNVAELQQLMMQGDYVNGNWIGNYVIIDLSGSTFTSFNYWSSTFIVGLTLPASLTKTCRAGDFELMNISRLTFQSTITAENFLLDANMWGDLKTKYLAGGQGTYTTTPPWGQVWTKQPN